MLAPCRGDLEVLEVMVSSTKLRRGSHRSNAFQVVLSGVDRDALEACELTLKRLQFTGVPNYFGPQRFVWMRRLFFCTFDVRRRVVVSPRRLAGVAAMPLRLAGVAAMPRRHDAVDAAARESTHAVSRTVSFPAGQGLRHGAARLQGSKETRGDVRE